MVFYWGVWEEFHASINSFVFIHELFLSNLFFLFLFCNRNDVHLEQW